MAAAGDGHKVPNRRVILKRYVTGFPSEDDMEVVTGTAHLAVLSGSAAVVLKNLYVSWDPYMRSRMIKHEDSSYVPDYVPGEVIKLWDSSFQIKNTRVLLFYYSVGGHGKKETSFCSCPWFISVDSRFYPFTRPICHLLNIL